MGDEQQEAQRRWHEVQKIAAVNERLTRENATLRRKSEALRKRLADAERKLQPGETPPDMHACERAIRDLELLELLRKHPEVQRAREYIGELRDGWRAGRDEGLAQVFADVVALLSPSDGGGGQ